MLGLCAKGALVHLGHIYPCGCQKNKLWIPRTLGDSRSIRRRTGKEPVLYLRDELQRWHWDCPSPIRLLRRLEMMMMKEANYLPLV